MTFNIGPVGGNFQAGFAQFKAKLESLGIPDDIISQGRDAVQAYAQQNNITLPAPPQPPQDGSIFDGQQGGNVQGSHKKHHGHRPSGPPPEVTSALKAGGATDAEIAGIKGPADAEALAAKYGVALPAPPAPPQGIPGGSIFNQVNQQ